MQRERRGALRQGCSRCISCLFTGLGGLVRTFCDTCMGPDYLFEKYSGVRTILGVPSECGTCYAGSTDKSLIPQGVPIPPSPVECTLKALAVEFLTWVAIKGADRASFYHWMGDPLRKVCIIVKKALFLN